MAGNMKLGEYNQEMKTLREIIEAVKDGEKPDYEDLLYGLLALSHLHAFDSQDMLKVYKKAQNDDSPFGLKFLAEESFNRSKCAMNVPPKEYVGDSHDPSNPEYQRERQLFGKLIDKILNDKPTRTD